MRTSIDGKGEAVDGDSTTTGAICVASGEGYLWEGLRVLRCGDPTTACPICGQEGVIVEGNESFISDGQPVAVDGSLVECGCPRGTNRVVAPVHGGFPQARPLTSSSTATAAQARSLAAATPGSVVPAAAEVLEPGFYIVQRSMSFMQVIESLGETYKPLPVSLLQRLNPTFVQGFKAGEIFVLGTPSNAFACSPVETELMMVAEKARESLAVLSDEEANFMMRHIGEIAGVLNGASQSMGVGKDMLERGLGQVKDTLKGIEALHQQQFALHGHLNSAEFFARRKALYQNLSAQLRAGFLNKTLNLGSYDMLRRDLGISTKSLVHHWKKAGVPGQIPGYATHLDEVAKMSNYLKYGGYAAIGLGAGSSYLKVQAACRAGETAACRKIRYTETASFSGGLGGGVVGAKLGAEASRLVCAFGIYGKITCGIVLVGSGSFAFSKGGEKFGEAAGEFVFEELYD